MKKGISGKKLSRTTNERKQLFRNIIREIVDHGFVETTIAKAKAVKPQVEKLVTIAKQKTLASFRRLIAEVVDTDIAKKLEGYGALFEKRPGGYTRIIRVGERGDGSKMVRLEWVEKIIEPEVTVQSQPKTKTEKESKKVVEKKTESAKGGSSLGRKKSRAKANRPRVEK